MFDIEALVAEMNATKPVYHRLVAVLSGLDARLVALLTLRERRRTLRHMTMTLTDQDRQEIREAYITDLVNRLATAESAIAALVWKTKTTPDECGAIDRALAAHPRPDRYENRGMGS